MAFYRKLFQYIDRKNLLLFYLYSEALEENIRVIRKERCDEDGNEVWYQMMLEYFVNSPYGKKHGCSNFDDLVSHLKHRQALELRIVKEIIGSNAIVLPAKEYDENQIRTVIGSGSEISYRIRYMNNEETVLLDDYGHVEDGVPSFAISLYKEYRGRGIGTEMMKTKKSILWCVNCKAAGEVRKDTKTLDILSER